MHFFQLHVPTAKFLYRHLKALAFATCCNLGSHFLWSRKLPDPSICLGRIEGKYIFSAQGGMEASSLGLGWQAMFHHTCRHKILRSVHRTLADYWQED